MGKVVRTKRVEADANDGGYYCSEQCNLGSESIKEVRDHIKKNPSHYIQHVKFLVFEWRWDASTS